MRADVATFQLPKAGNSPAEYEDAAWVPRKQVDEESSLALAIADGATETIFSGLWARLLVRNYGRHGKSSDRFERSIGRSGRVWQRLTATPDPPWYIEEKLRRGAYSSLAGVTLSEHPEGSAGAGNWCAVAIGDSCIFQIRQQELLLAFPVSDSQAFSRQPELLSTELPSITLPGVQAAMGEWRAGDCFYLMTDSLACWFLKLWESNGDSLAMIRAIQTQSDFDNLVSRERSRVVSGSVPVLRNDDVTLISCALL